MRGILTLLACAGMVSMVDAQISSTAQGSTAVRALPVLATTTSGRATTIILDISGAQSWDSTGSPNNQWFYVPIPAGDRMTGVGWDVNLTTVGGSYLSEARFYFDGSDQDGLGLWLTPGVADTFPGSGTYSSGGILDLSDNGIADIPILADGQLWIELNESYDDVAGAVDADWTATSTLTIVHETPVPPPPAIWIEDFDSGTWPPAGWTVVDNVGNGDTWQTSSYFGNGNLTPYGTGECAAVDDDFYGSSALVDTELISPAVDIPAGAYDLWFENYFNALGDSAMVDLSVSGGPWTNIKTWLVDDSSTAMISLYDWSATNGVQFRFHYDDLGSWAWQWHVDDVAVRPGTPPPLALWEEDFDGGVFPPAGWTVIDNAGNGNVWALTSNWTKGNQSGGTGEAAAIDDDEIGSGNRTDTELITPSFNVPSTGLDFMYIHNFYDQYVAEMGYVDISAGGGAWTNLETYSDANSGTKAFNMDAYVGANVQVRFHYDDVNSWGWYWHVDDVGLYQPFSGPGTAFCFGNTASGNPCPCGNDNDGTDPLGAGCAHDDSSSGGRLQASGVASVTGDTLLFEGFHGPISNSSMFFPANNSQDGNGLFLGDGIRCAGGGLIRLKVKLTDASGYADSTPMVVTARSASFGHPISAGETLYYQWWFRDANGSPCGFESNTSNGYEITWAP